MIKRIIILVFILGCKSIYAQHFSFSIEGVHLVFDYQINEQLKESILLQNTTESSIYIPILADTSLYFFTLQKTVHSYFGIKNSLLGPPNLGGKVLLKEVKGGDSIKFDVVVLFKEQHTDEYRVAFDYIKEVDIKKRKVEADKKDNIIMNAKDYILNCKSFYFLSNPSEKE